MGREQFGYWEHTQLIIDVVEGNGGMFSLDNGSGVRFLTRSRLFSDEELAALPPANTPYYNHKNRRSSCKRKLS
jgi:hypothetical protein